MNFFPFSFPIKSLNLLGLTICLFDIFPSLIISEAFCFSVIKKVSLVFPIIKRQFGIGLFGLSEPLIFKVHATFSGALIKI